MTEAPLPEPVESEGTKITKAISTVTWTASEAAAVKPGEYQDFSISAGPCRSRARSSCFGHPDVL